MAHRWNDADHDWRRQAAYAWIAAVVVTAVTVITTRHELGGIRREIDALHSDIRAEFRAFRNESRREAGRAGRHGAQQPQNRVIPPKESAMTR